MVVCMDVVLHAVLLLLCAHKDELLRSVRLYILVLVQGIHLVAP